MKRWILAVIILIGIFAWLMFVAFISAEVGSALEVPTPFPEETPTPYTGPQRPPEGTSQLYFPLVFKDGYPAMLPVHITGRILQADGKPYAGQIVRAAEVWCENFNLQDYDGRVGCAVVLDMAFDPGSCTDENGRFDLVVDGWFLERVPYWILVVGNVEYYDYEIIYNGIWAESVIRIWPGHEYDRGEIVSEVSRSWCPVGPPYPGPGMESEQTGKYVWLFEKLDTYSLTKFQWEIEKR